MKQISIAFVLCFFINSVFSQMVRPPSGFLLNSQYDSNVTLTKADYIVQGEVLVTKTAVMTMEPGVRIFFTPGSSIKIKGGLNIKGEAKNLVQLSSAGGKESGTGLIIASNTPAQDIKINYASFKYLIKPLNFEKDWFRKGVEITNSDFFNTYEFNDAISVREVEFYLNKQTIDFVFKNNVFGDNYSNISIYNASSYRVKYLFENNIFANNFYFDTRSKAESNPLYVTLDDIQGKYTLKAENNAFSDNYVFTQDSLILVNHGTIGHIYNKAGFNTNSNYSKNKVEKIYDQKNPVNQSHAFHIDAKIDGQSLSMFEPVEALAGKNLKIYFNTPIGNTQTEYKVFYNFIDTVTGEILKRQVDKNFQFTANSGSVADFTFDSVILTESISYLSIENLKNLDGVSVPSINLGILDFFKRAGSRNYKMDFVSLMPIDISKLNSKMVDTTKNWIFEIDTPTVGHWEVGLFGGVSGYAGDINQRWFRQDKYYTAFGAKLKYHYNRNITARFSLDYTTVSAFDYGAYGARKLNFKSNLLSAFVMAEYSFNDKYSANFNDRYRTTRKRNRLKRKYGDLEEYEKRRYKKELTMGRKLYPTLGIGVGVVKFNPMGKYTDGNWYALRQFGLEGQTLAGGKKYSTLMISMPIMAGINYRINDNIKVAFEFTAFKLFADYLDDMSKVAYVDDELIRNANPGNEDMASYFRNPGVDLGARGNPNDRDFFYNMGLSIWYRFGKKKRNDDYQPK